MHDSNSQLAVADRRKWVASQYMSGRAPLAIWMEYGKLYGLSKKSLENDITIARAELGFSVREQYDEILNNQLLLLYSIQDRAMQEADNGLAMRCSKQINDLLKLVNPDRKEKRATYNQTNNINLPPLSVSQIKELLGKTTEVKNTETDSEVIEILE